MSVRRCTFCATLFDDQSQLDVQFVNGVQPIKKGVPTSWIAPSRFRTSRFLTLLKKFSGSESWSFETCRSGNRISTWKSVGSTESGAFVIDPGGGFRVAHRSASETASELLLGPQALGRGWLQLTKRRYSTPD